MRLLSADIHKTLLSLSSFAQPGFFLLYILAGSYFLYLNFHSFDLYLLNIVSIFLLLISHLVRSLRLWMIISDKKVKLRDVCLLTFAGDALGAYVNKFFGELTKLLVFSFDYRNRFLRFIVASIYSRLVDGVFILAFMAFVYLGARQSPDRLLFVSLVAFVGISTLFLVTFGSLSQRTIEFLVVNSHNKIALTIIRIIYSVRRCIDDTKIKRLDTFFSTFCLTSIIWTCEAVAFFLIIDNPANNSPNAINAALANILSIVQSSALSQLLKPESPYYVLFNSIFIFSLLFLFFKYREFRLNKK